MISFLLKGGGVAVELKESLKIMRTERAITQAQLAKKLNISIKTISHWETGYTEPSINQLIVLADLYSVSLDELVGRNF